MKKNLSAFLFLAALLCGCFYFCSIRNYQKKPANTANTPTASRISDSLHIIKDLYVLASDSLEGRETGTPGGIKSRNYLVKRFGEIGLRAQAPGFQEHFTFSHGKDKPQWSGTNVTGMLRGTKKPRKYIVISAHYDHLGVKNGDIFNGADDNASGVSALLHLAEYFKKHPPKHSLIFCAFDAEEKGLEGAKAWLGAHPAGDSILFNLNMDMISRSDKQELYCSGTYHHPALRPLLEPLQAQTPVNIRFGHDRPEEKHDDWTAQSDHFIFHEAHIPFLYLGVEDHADYHKHTDEADKIDKSFFTEACYLTEKVVLMLDKNLEKIVAK